MNRNELDAFAAHYGLSADAVTSALDVADARPTRADMMRFGVRALHLAGVLSIAAGVVFFVAANWGTLGIFGRFALVEGTLDEGGVAAGDADGRDVGAGEDGRALRIAFRMRGGRVWLGTNAYFFQEGTGERYDEARYGEFRIDPSTGEAVLVGLRDEELSSL